MTYLRLAASRVIGGVMLLLVLSVAVFGMVRMLPGSVEDVLLGTESATDEARQRVRDRYGLDQPLAQQYGTWLGGVLQGDLGESPRTRASVTGELVAKTWTSLQLGTAAVVVALVVSLTLGTLAGLRRRSVADRLATGFALAGSSVPDFVIGLLLIMFVARPLRIFPTSGWAPVGSGPLEWVRYAALPVAALALILIGVLTRLTRSAVAETSEQEFVRTARGKGLSPVRVLTHHIMRPSLLSVSAAVGVQLVAVLGGVVVVEVVFSIPGLGRLILDAIRNRDYVMTQGATLFIGGWTVAVSLLIELLHGALDPRTRLRSLT